MNAICIQESWLSDNDDLSLFLLKGIHCISKGKSASSKGGLFIYLQEHLNYKIVKYRCTDADPNLNYNVY